MTRIDFYLLKTGDPQERLRVACRLIEKAYQQSHNVFINCSDSSVAQQLDDMLWNIRETAFLPHTNLHNEDIDSNAAIVIGAHPPEACHDLIINIDKTVPKVFERFTRLLELVCQGDEAWVDIGRNNYRHYKQIGYPIHTHNL
ncbi:MAG: hypothetical protein RL336_385 [Pseudomonadota bacterium]